MCTEPVPGNASSQKLRVTGPALRERMVDFDSVSERGICHITPCTDLDNASPAC
jgi:hypothetical protein